MVGYTATIFWILAGLLLGCLPFSYWVGRLFLSRDIRDYGDGNPGATNVLHAGGPVLFAMACLLDAFKAALPVCLAQYVSNITGWQLSLVAIAPLVGNVFTPFLHFRGGTGVAVVYGVWLALMGWVGPVLYGTCIGLLFIFIRETPWCAVFGMLLFSAVLALLQYPLYLAAAGAGHAALMFYSRRQHFTHWPVMQQWVISRSNKSNEDPPFQTR